MANPGNTLTELSPERKRALLAEMLRRKAAAKTYPLSFAQERFWLLDQLEEAGSIFNTLPNAVRLRGPLEPTLLIRAMQDIVRQHETLRTNIVVREGEPCQVVHAYQPPAIALEDLEAQMGDSAAAERLALELARQETQRRFDLAKDPLYHVRLLRIGAEDHVVLLTMHHIISDNWSMRLLMRELSTRYHALQRGETQASPALPIQYGDYAVWERRRLSGARREALLKFWEQRLEGAPELLELPLDRPRPAQQSFNGTEFTMMLPKATADAVAELSRQHTCTHLMTLLAAFKVLLYRYSGAEDVSVGTPVSTRSRAELEDLIGFFVNTMVLRTRLDGNESFAALLQRFKQQTLAAYQRKELPFDQVVQRLRPRRDLAYAPLFQVMFALQDGLELGKGLPELQVETIDQKRSKIQFDLLVLAFEQANGIKLVVEYNTDIFERTTVQRLMAHYARLLTLVTANPEQKVGDLDLLTPETRHQLLRQWNETARALPAETVLAPILAQAAASPAAPAVFGETPEPTSTLTYGRLGRDINRVATHLHNAGFGRGDVIGLCLSRTPNLVVALLGVLRAGAAYVPLDPHYPAERLAAMITDGKVTTVLGDAATEAVPLPEGVQRMAVEPMCATEPAACPTLPQPWPEDVAYLMYTSGSTGKPKGIRIGHRALLNLLRAFAAAPGFSRTDHLLAVTSLNFDIAGLELLLPLIRGGRLTIARRETTLDGTRLARLIASSGCTLLQATPATWRLLLDADWDNAEGIRCWSGGEALPPELAQRLAALNGRPVNLYGPAETTIWSTFDQLDPARGVTLGRPIDNTQIYLLDDNLQPVPLGVAGELWIAGDGLAHGYHQRARLTAQQFRPNPFSDQPGARMYRTGDLARYREDGRLLYLGRRDFQVKLRGFRIELGEIEACLEQHASLKQAVVVRNETAGRHLLIAYVTPAVDNKLDVAALRAHLAHTLPDYMIPALFVSRERLPLNPNGKVDRNLLRRLAPPQSAVAALGTGDGRPKTPTEEVVAGLWADILGLRTVDATVSFFDMGGHSLQATRILTRVNQVFSVDLPVRLLFEQPKVRGFAAAIDEAANQTQTVLPPITAAAPGTAQPLSFAQQRLWFLRELEGDTAAYNMADVIHIEGALDALILARVAREILERHQVLRTRFNVLEADGVPYQEVVTDCAIDIPCDDLRALDAAAREKRREAVIEQFLAKPFDFAKPPLLRLQLIREDETEYYLLVAMHHIASDGWSLNVLMRELTTLYRAFADNQPLPPAPSIQYADFAVWQRQQLAGEPLNQQLAYWRAQLAELPPLLELPTDFARPAEQSYRGATAVFHIDPRCSAEIAAFGRKQGATLFMTLLSAFQALLFRLSGSDQVAVGSPIANRTRGELEGLIGFFVNTLVLNARFQPETTFRELVQQNRATTLDAYDNQDLPFEQLVEALNPERSLAHSPLFQVMFEVRNAERQSTTVEGLTLTPQNRAGHTTKFDLSLTLTETEAGLSGALEYAVDLYSAEGAKALIDQFTTVLSNVVANPDLPLARVGLMNETAATGALQAGYGASLAVDPHLTLLDLLDRQVQQAPRQTAVIDGTNHLSYAEWHRRANALAGRLQRRGIGPGDRVAVAITRSAETLIAVYAVLKTGAAYVPLDPQLPTKRLQYLLDDAQAKLVLTRGDQLPADLPCPCPKLDVNEASQTSELVQEVSVAIDPRRPAYTVYTSGSTNHPKGVVVSHAALVNMFHAWRQDYRLEQRHIHLQMANLSFDVYAGDWVRCLCSGGTLVICPTEYLGDPEKLFGLAAEHRTTIAEFVPVVLKSLVAYCEQHKHSLDFFELIACGSDSWTIADYHHIRSFLKPSTRFINSYGVTEAAVDSCWFETDQPQKFRKLPMGKPFANVACHVLDERLQPLPANIPGELYLAGAGLAEGYHGRPAATAAAFLPHPAPRFAGERLYRTGDKAFRRSDGHLVFLGRVDFQIKIRGIRIELGEIEAVLQRHEAVAQVVVTDQLDSAGEKRLVAYVVRDGQEVSADLVSALRETVRLSLPEYMVPNAFILLPQLPLNANGKVDRKALPVPRDEDFCDTTTLVAPRTPLEQTIAEIWATVLHRPEIGVTHNFFQLGGHSLLATQVVSRLRNSLKRDVPVRVMFEHPTIAELATHLAGQEQTQPQAEALPLQPVSRDGRLALSFAQQRLWFLEQLEQTQGAYNIPAGLRLKGKLQIAALRRALETIVLRHEVLRTTFRQVAGTPRLHIEAEADYLWQELDLRGLCEAQQIDEIGRIGRAQLGQTFDLAEGPLLRLALLQLGDNDHVLIAVMHHIVSDGWSFGVLIRELIALYGAFSAGKPSPLPPLPIQYADFAAWQRRTLTGDAVAQQLAYWRKQLQGAAYREIPAEKARPATRSHQGATLRETWPEDMAAALEQLALQHEATLFMVLIAGFNALLFAYTEHHDVVVGTDVAGRDRTDIEPLIGFFVNQVALRTDLSGNPDFAELLARSKQVILAAYAHRELPFDVLVGDLKQDRDLSRTPLFQSKLVLQNTPAETLALPNLDLEPMDLTEETAKFDLLLNMERLPQGLSAALQFNTDLFTAPGMQQLLDQFRALLQRAGEQPALGLSDLVAPVVAQREQARNQSAAKASQTSLNKLRRLRRNRD